MALQLQGEVLNVIDRTYTKRDTGEEIKSAVAFVLSGTDLDSPIMEVRADRDHFAEFMREMPKYHRKVVTLSADARSYRDSSNVTFDFLGIAQKGAAA